MCYNYDNLSRVTSRVIKSLANDSVISTENYTYDAAGNLTSAPNDSFAYDVNNRLVSYNGNSVTYDLDGNMTHDGVCSYTYDSANRLTSFGGHAYTYTSADIRIRNLCADEDTTYTYDTNSKLSKLLTKMTNGTVTKYVYGRGLIGEQTGSTFKIYHFDCRGSTLAIADANGNITDTFAYDTYGNLASRTGTSKVIFLYNGRDGVIADDNGLYYMRARYYSPDMRRFINADIVAGQISNAVTLNRFAYANGNPVSNVDPFGLMAMANPRSTRIVYNDGARGTEKKSEAMEAARAIGKRATISDGEIIISMEIEGEEINRLAEVLGLELTCDLISASACDKFLEEQDREFMLSDACVSKEIYDHVEAYNWAVGEESKQNYLAAGYDLIQRANKIVNGDFRGAFQSQADAVYQATVNINMKESDIEKTNSITSQSVVFGYKDGLREEYKGTEYDPWADQRLKSNLWRKK